MFHSQYSITIIYITQQNVNGERKTPKLAKTQKKDPCKTEFCLDRKQGIWYTCLLYTSDAADEL